MAETAMINIAKLTENAPELTRIKANLQCPADRILISDDRGRNSASIFCSENLAHRTSRARNPVHLSSQVESRGSGGDRDRQAEMRRDDRNETGRQSRASLKSTRPAQSGREAESVCLPA